jgi:hypothetical protein
MKALLKRGDTFEKFFKSATVIITAFVCHVWGNGAGAGTNRA